LGLDAADLLVMQLLQKIEMEKKKMASSDNSPRPTSEEQRLEEKRA
jgi:hypothetical protein